MRIVGLLIVLLSLPVFYSLLKSNASFRRIAWLFIGASPFIIGYFHLEVSIVSWAYWPGYVKGMIVSLLDTLAFAVLLTNRRYPSSRAIFFAYCAYLIATIIASAFATPWAASLFFSWQLMRAILVFSAVARVATQPEGAKHIISGMAAGVAFEAVFSVMQRIEGVTQASGTFGHQNLLGLATHFGLLMSLAAMLAGDRSWLPRIGVVGGCIAVILTGSRATTGLAGAGVVLLVVLSLIRHRTAFKMRVAGIGIALLLAGAPIAYLTLQHRFASEPSFGGYDERAAFERAARSMWSDHPMGVGANLYVVTANTSGYSQRAGVIWTASSRSANVHNTYLLVGAETGYLGFISFIVLFLLAIITAMRLAWSRPRGSTGELCLGAGVTLIIVALHCLYEWVFVTWIIQYLFAIILGLVAGSDTQRRLLIQRIRRKVSASVSSEANGEHRIDSPLNGIQVR